MQLRPSPSFIPDFGDSTRLRHPEYPVKLSAQWRNGLESTGRLVGRARTTYRSRFGWREGSGRLVVWERVIGSTRCWVSIPRRIARVVLHDSSVRLSSSWLAFLAFFMHRQRILNTFPMSLPSLAFKSNSGRDSYLKASCFSASPRAGLASVHAPRSIGSP